MSIERPWLDHYPAGIPADIDVNAYRSVAAVFEESFQKFRDRPAYKNFGKVLTYGQIDELSTAFAGYLSGELGLKKGDRLAIMLPNLLQYPIVLFGALRLGLTVVNTNPLYTARELHHQLEDSGAKVLVVLDNFAATAEQALDGTQVKSVITTGVGDMVGFPKGNIINFVVRNIRKEVPAYKLPMAVRFKDALARGKSHPMPKTDVGHDDIAFLQYTGGTTGVAKGAMLTHRNMVANMLQADAWISGSAKEGEEIIVTALPLYHIFSLTANGLVFTRMGALNLLITNPRDMKGFVKELSKERFTAITGVNTLFNGLLNTPGFADLDFSALHLSLGGGMAVQRSVAERWKKTTGITLAEAYGLTETSPAACINPLDIDRRADLDRRRPGAADRRSGRALHQGPAGDEGLLEPSRRDRQGARRQRLAAHGRHRPDGCQRLPVYRRSQERHDPRVRLQRVPERDRRHRHAPSGRRRSRRRGCGRRALGRGGEDLRGAQGPVAHRGSLARVLPRKPHRLQAPEADRVP
jgi:long-chain acyl-CoA synthetase